MSEEYSVYSKFDLELHKEKYPNYLEVVILEDGTVEYAVPSHQEKGIKIACDKLGVTRAELMEMCPPKYYFDFLTWLAMITGIIFVWDSWHVASGCSRKQMAMLKMMKIRGVYKGAFPLISEKQGEKTQE